MLLYNYELSHNHAHNMPITYFTMNVTYANHAHSDFYYMLLRRV